jgi:septum formation protein
VTLNPDLVLASNSPRRRELLALSGWTFAVLPADVDEDPRLGEDPGTYVLRLAEAKVRACAARSPADQVVLAADTTVALDGRLLGKPRDAAEAADMLRQLRGRSHRVYTGLAAMLAPDGNPATDLCVTEVPMRNYAPAEMNAYIASGDPLDKAGAYAIQHPGFHPVEALAGCYASVMGLPLCHLVRTLARLGKRPPADVPAGCQSALNYTCPISAAVLRGESVG